MKTQSRIAAAFIGMLALTISSALPVQASARAADMTIAEQAAELLPASELQQWESLTPAEQATVNEVLSDANFGVTGAESAMEAKYSALDVTESTSAPVPSSSAGRAAGSRTVWYEQNWTIIGITYAAIRTSTNVKYSGSRVTAINSCVGVVNNYVPARQITSSNFSSLASGQATCKTEVWLKRVAQKTDYGVQGIKIDGNGKILQKWSL